MDAQATDGLLRFFRSMQDPRADNARHSLGDILTVAILAVLCGSDSWESVELWGQGNVAWLAEFCELPHGRTVARHVRPRVRHARPAGF
jgi:hypothetical protein